MKRPVVFLLLSLIAPSAFAQFTYGIKGGTNLVNTALEFGSLMSDFDTQYRLSYHAGVYGMYRINERFSIREELLFSVKGYGLEASSLVVPGTTEKVRLHLNYISLPILAGYAIGKRFMVHVGPEIGYLLSAQFKNDGGTNDAGIIYNETIDLGAVAGLNYSLSERMQVELRYTHGLTDVADEVYSLIDAQNPLIDDFYLNARNRVFQLSLAYRVR